MVKQELVFQSAQERMEQSGWQHMVMVRMVRSELGNFYKHCYDFTDWDSLRSDYLWVVLAARDGRVGRDE